MDDLRISLLGPNLGTTDENIFLVHVPLLGAYKQFFIWVFSVISVNHFLCCDRFDRARQKIAEKYDHVEQELIEEFRLAHQQTDKRKMKRIAAVLQNFKVSQMGVGVWEREIDRERQREAWKKCVDFACRAIFQESRHCDPSPTSSAPPKKEKKVYSPSSLSTVTQHDKASLPTVTFMLRPHSDWSLGWPSHMS